MIIANEAIAIAEGHGDAAMELLKAGAESDKEDADGHLAIQLAPDKQVSPCFSPCLVVVCNFFGKS